MKTNTKALLVAMSASVGLSAMAMTIEQAREQALSSTNFWGTAFAEYRLGVGDAVPFLATNETQAARQALCDWYVVVAGFSSPTNSMSEHDLWLEEQVSSMSAYSRFLLDPLFTNAWMAAACRLGTLRDETPSMDTLRQCVRGRFPVNGGLFDDTDEMRACLLREQDLAFARQRASDSLVRPVVEMFGRRGIRLLPLEERVAFASNFVSQARLSVKEANVVMSGLVDD